MTSRAKTDTSKASNTDASQAMKSLVRLLARQAARVTYQETNQTTVIDSNAQNDSTDSSQS